METYCRSDAETLMNELSRQHKAFIFAIDYKGEKAYVEPICDIKTSECLFAFPGISNMDGLSPQSTKTPRWDVEIPDEADYQRSFNVVRRGLLAGNSYLVNLTCSVKVDTDISLRDICLRSDAPYRLWIRDKFVCFSPEMFIRSDGTTISSFPMKGTADANEPEADVKLMENAKEAAEHATIVDLIRNELSKVSSHVYVKRYRYMETLQTNRGPLLQTSSEICGTLSERYRQDAGTLIFSQLPAGSITGAPKKSTCSIIAEAENYDRCFYTGVMGWCDGKHIDSAVMIRFIDRETDGLHFKAGGGITAKSNWKDEYNEVINKIYVPIH
jgi:para-aminobenzoate synthetase component 1